MDFETLFWGFLPKKKNEKCNLVKASFAPVEVELEVLWKCSRTALEVRLEVCLEMAVWEAGWLAGWLAGSLAGWLAVNRSLCSICE